uniref:Ldh family oxidoreductase n=1 Tax=Echinostoma caproni TaxID=27848 RepID=A0A183AI08_9TREM
LTIAAPSSKPGDEFVLDMATSAVALGKVSTLYDIAWLLYLGDPAESWLEMCRRRNLPIPDGWGADKEGRRKLLFRFHNWHLPVFPDLGGYKGYGLGMVVELFCGILANAAYGPSIRRWMNTDRVANLGQSFVAIDPNAFAPGFGDRMADYMNIMRNLPRVNEEEPVLIPGDPERAHMTECEKIGGIRYPLVLIESINQLADRLQVPRVPIFKQL